MTLTNSKSGRFKMTFKFLSIPLIAAALVGVAATGAQAAGKSKQPAYQDW